MEVDPFWCLTLFCVCVYVCMVSVLVEPHLERPVQGVTHPFLRVIPSSVFAGQSVFIEPLVQRMLREKVRLYSIPSIFTNPLINSPNSQIPWPLVFHWGLHSTSTTDLSCFIRLHDCRRTGLIRICRFSTCFHFFPMFFTPQKSYVFFDVCPAGIDVACHQRVLVCSWPFGTAIERFQALLEESPGAEWTDWLAGDKLQGGRVRKAKVVGWYVPQP